MLLKAGKILILTGLILSSLLLRAENNKTPEKNELDSVLASVNGEPILLSDVILESAKDENILSAALDAEKAKEIILEMRKNLVDEIINRKLILAEYENGTFRIPEEYVNNAIDDIARKSNYFSRKKFYQALRENGIALHEFRDLIRERVIVEYCVGRKLYNHVSISPKKVYEYYQAHKADEFTTPDKIELSMVFIDKNRADFKEVAEKVTALLASRPTDFPQLASEYSNHENSRKNNGVVGFFAIDEIREEFKPFVRDLRIGIVSEAIETEEGIYFLVVNKVEKGREIPLREIEPELRKKLEVKAREKVYKDYIKYLRSNAIIEYYF